MKKLLILFALVSFTVSVSAQSPFTGFNKPLKSAISTDKALLNGEWLIRTDVGLVCNAYVFKNEGIGLEKKDFSKMFAGLLFTHVKADATRDWGVGLGLTIPTVTDRMGIAALGGWSIFRVGVNYDFGLSAKEGVAFLGGITVDLFNLYSE